MKKVVGKFALSTGFSIVKSQTMQVKKSSDIYALTQVPDLENISSESSSLTGSDIPSVTELDIEEYKDIPVSVITIPPLPTGPITTKEYNKQIDILRRIKHLKEHKLKLLEAEYRANALLDQKGVFDYMDSLRDATKKIKAETKSIKYDTFTYSSIHKREQQQGYFMKTRIEDKHRVMASFGINLEKMMLKHDINARQLYQPDRILETEILDATRKKNTYVVKKQELRAPVKKKHLQIEINKKQQLSEKLDTKVRNKNDRMSKIELQLKIVHMKVAELKSSIAKYEEDNKENEKFFQIMFKKYNTEDVAKVEELILADKSIIELQHEADIINMTLESYGPLSKKYMNEAQRAYEQIDQNKIIELLIKKEVESTNEFERKEKEIEFLSEITEKNNSKILAIFNILVTMQKQIYKIHESKIKIIYTNRVIEQRILKNSLTLPSNGAIKRSFKVEEVIQLLMVISLQIKQFHEYLPFKLHFYSDGGDWGKFDRAVINKKGTKKRRSFVFKQSEVKEFKDLNKEKVENIFTKVSELIKYSDKLSKKKKYSPLKDQKESEPIGQKKTIEKNFIMQSRKLQSNQKQKEEQKAEMERRLAEEKTKVNDMKLKHKWAYAIMKLNQKYDEKYMRNLNDVREQDHINESTRNQIKSELEALGQETTRASLQHEKEKGFRSVNVFNEMMSKEPASMKKPIPIYPKQQMSIQRQPLFPHSPPKKKTVFKEIKVRKQNFLRKPRSMFSQPNLLEYTYSPSSRKDDSIVTPKSSQPKHTSLRIVEEMTPTSGGGMMHQISYSIGRQDKLLDNYYNSIQKRNQHTQAYTDRQTTKVTEESEEMGKSAVGDKGLTSPATAGSQCKFRNSKSSFFDSLPAQNENKQELNQKLAVQRVYGRSLILTGLKLPEMNCKHRPITATTSRKGSECGSNLVSDQISVNSARAMKNQTDQIQRMMNIYASQPMLKSFK